MPVAFTAETSGWIKQDAFASVATKGSAMAGNGSAATPYDCVQEALDAMTVFAPGDIAVTKSGHGHWTVTFQGAYAATNVAKLGIDTSALFGMLPSGAVTVTQEGATGLNEIQKIDLINIFVPPSAGRFTLSFNSLTGTVSDQEKALTWALNIARSDTVLFQAVEGRIYIGVIPPSIKVSLPPNSIVVFPLTNEAPVHRFIGGGGRVATTCRIGIKVMSPDATVAEYTKMIQQRIIEVFRYHTNIALTDGFLHHCVFAGTARASEMDGAQQWQNLSVHLNFSLNQGN